MARLFSNLFATDRPFLVASTLSLLPIRIRSESRKESRAMRKRTERLPDGDRGLPPGWRAEMPSELHPLKSTLKTIANKEVLRNKSRAGTVFGHAQRPSKNAFQLHNGLSNRQSALLVQMRTEKRGLKDFNRRVPDAISANCFAETAVSGVLLRCQKIRRLRLLNERRAAAKAIKFNGRQILGQFRIENYCIDAAEAR